MAVIAPNSEIYLIKCPIELDNLNQLSFANATAQHNYFNSLPKLALTNATFQRKDGTIRWPGSMEDILEYNYCMYRNKNHGNKWFYAFISNMSYMSDQMTAIKIKTDVWQTWQFDLTWKNTYVEREHVNDDTVGLHTIPEGLDTGEYVCNSLETWSYAKRQYYPVNQIPDGAVMVCIQLTTLKIKNSEPSNGPIRNIINGVPQGTYIVGIPYNKDSLVGIYTLIGAYDGDSKADAIVSMFLCPRKVCEWEMSRGTGIWGAPDTFYFPLDSDQAYSNSLSNYDVYMNYTLDGYTPKNNKCLVSPYNYFHITNNAGSDIEFYYEDFKANPATFVIKGSLEQGGSVALIPTNSKRTTTYSGGLSDGYNESIMAGSLPQLSWTSDYYLNWEARNGKNIAIQTGLQAAGFGLNFISNIVGGAFTHGQNVDTAVQRGYFPDEEQMSVNGGGLIGNVLGFASQVANTQNTIRQAKMVPPQAKGNTSGGYFQFANNSCHYTVYQMSVRAEYARCIDNYFSMFGYKVNTMKIPNVTGRRNWNYVKTVGCNIIGDIPQGDLNEIKAIFNNGVTIWHNPATYLDYSQNNDIL
jgi:hypothetical protein